MSDGCQRALDAAEHVRDLAGKVHNGGWLRFDGSRLAGSTSKLTRAQKSRFVAICWIGQIYKHFPEPKPSYVADWDDLPVWQQETDADIFERIERDSSQKGH